MHAQGQHRTDQHAHHSSAVLAAVNHAESLPLSTKLEGLSLYGVFPFQLGTFQPVTAASQRETETNLHRCQGVASYTDGDSVHEG